MFHNVVQQPVQDAVGFKNSIHLTANVPKNLTVKKFLESVKI